ncbi:MAG TPA: pyruvate kinase alpha/beta domain-containing protein, partial [Gammaproteobacteria bacterium]
IPIYAFTRHEATRNRVRLYRGVYAAPFDVVEVQADTVHLEAFRVLQDQGAIAPGDLVLFTTGDVRGVEGRTNTLQIIEVPKDIGVQTFSG